MWGAGLDIYTSAMPFPLTAPRWPLLQTLPNMDLYHGGQKANTMSFYRRSIIKNNILCRSLYNNQNTKKGKGTAHSIWEKHKNRVRFVKCQRWFHLDGGGYIKAVCFVDRCHFWCGLTRLALDLGFLGWVWFLYIYTSKWVLTSGAERRDKGARDFCRSHDFSVNQSSSEAFFWRWDGQTHIALRR